MLIGSFLRDIQSCLCDVSQVLDGWHQDGTAWTEFDGAVQEEVTFYLHEIELLLAELRIIENASEEKTR